jgi:hypothetical protein
MDNVTKITNITITENTVVLSLERYNSLLEKEELLEKNVIYTVRHMFGAEKVYTNDKAVKQLAEDLKKANTQKTELSEQVNVLTTHNKGLLKIEKDISWKKIFKMIRLKF